MPRTKLQELVFGVIMVALMVYFMVTYNMAISSGGLTANVMLQSLCALPIPAVVAFSIESLLVGKLAKRAAFKMFDPTTTQPIVITLAISMVTVSLMCPIMTLFANVAFEFQSWQALIPNWLTTWAVSMPAALLWNICYAGPLARFLFGKIFPPQEPDDAQAKDKDC